MWKVSAVTLLCVFAVCNGDTNDSFGVSFADKAGDKIFKAYTRNITFNYTLYESEVTLKSFSLHPDIATVVPEEIKLQQCVNGTVCQTQITIQGVQLGRTEINFTFEPNINISQADNLKVSVIRVPDPISAIYGFILLALQIILNFALGCKLNIDVVIANLKKPLAVIVGVSCQFILMPLFAFGLAMAFDLSDAFAIGLLVTGCAPGGGTSNIFTVLLDGDVDLSITMTTITCLIAFGSMPLWLFVYARFFTEGVSPVVVPYFDIMITLLTATAPLIPGIIIRKCKRSIADKLAKIVQPVSLFLVLATTGVSVYNGLYIFSLFTWERFISSGLLPLCGLLVGMLVAVIFRRGLPQVKTIGLETGIQNSVISIAVINISQPKPEGDIMMIMPSYSVLFILVLLLIVTLAHKIALCCSPKYKKRHEAYQDSRPLHEEEQASKYEVNGNTKIADDENGMTDNGHTNIAFEGDKETTKM